MKLEHPATHVISLSFDDLAKIKLGTDPFNGETLGTAGQLPIATIPAGGAVELASVFSQLHLLVLLTLLLMLAHYW